jgi:hypothetical protein
VIQVPIWQHEIQDAILEFAGTFIDKIVWSDARALGIFLWLDKIDIIVSDKALLCATAFNSPNLILTPHLHWHYSAPANGEHSP